MQLSSLIEIAGASRITDNVWAAPCPVCQTDPFGLVRGDWALTIHRGETPTCQCSLVEHDAALMARHLGMPADEFTDLWDDTLTVLPLVAALTAEPEPWAPTDLTRFLVGDWDPERTTVLTRADGVSLFYGARVHSLHGESESGKSWVALAACAEVLERGTAKVLFLDFESNPGTVVERLRALGVRPLDITDRFIYVRPDGPYTIEQFAALTSRHWAVAVIDGVTEALGVFGLDGRNESDVRRYGALLPRPLAATGAAVIQVDHVTKSNDGRGRFAIGSQHKLAALDGVAYTVEPIGAAMMRPGQVGRLALRVAKDRPGWVRQHSGGIRTSDRTQEAAVLEFDAANPKAITLDVQVPDTFDAETGTAVPAWPTTLMERVSTYLEHNPGSSRNAVQRDVEGKATGLRWAIDLLVEHGYVTAEDGPRKSVLLTNARRFDADDRVPSMGDTVTPASTSVTVSPYRGDTGTQSFTVSGTQSGHGGTQSQTTPQSGAGMPVPARVDGPSLDDLEVLSDE